ncbi:MAG: response regulator [Bacteroidota bacterium]
MKILIVEDDELQRILLRKIIEKHYRCEIFEARNGIEGLRVVEDSQPDLIFLDIWMPILNGLNMLIRMKEKNLLGSVSVVVLSAITNREIAAQIIALGVNDFLLKPLKNDQVLERISKVIENIKNKNQVITAE